MRFTGRGAARRALLIGALVTASTILASAQGAANAAPSRAPDVVGTPDLVVRRDVLAHQWLVREEDLPAGLCSVVEGGITPGTHTLLRFTVSTPNIGDADLVLGDPNKHMADNDGLFEMASCHQHYHFRNHSLWELVDPATGRAWRAAKHAFCMIDVDPNPAHYGEPPRAAQFKRCGGVGVPGNQGLSHGWADTYRWTLGGQYFVLDGGAGEPPVPAGNYLLRITVNPSFVPVGGEPCPYPDPQRPGSCHMLQESSYVNNVAEVSITIPDHPGKHGVGPLADAPSPGVEQIDE